MEVHEYLNTGFDGADCEHLDGEIVERNTGEFPHGKIQARLGHLLLQLAPNLGIQVASAARIRISAARLSHSRSSGSHPSRFLASRPARLSH